MRLLEDVLAVIGATEHPTFSKLQLLCSKEQVFQQVGEDVWERFHAARVRGFFHIRLCLTIDSMKWSKEFWAVAARKARAPLASVTPSS